MTPFPNIIILHKKNEIIFYKNTSRLIHRERSKINSKVKKILNFKKILKDDSNLILIIQGDLIYLESVKKYIISHNIKKIYFFIDDVFRISHLDSKQRLETHMLEKDLNSCIVKELEIINHILKKTKVIKKEIYHCEYNNTLVEKKYKHKLKYFDIFLSNYVNGLSMTMPYQANIKYKICCFNHRVELHRQLIASLLYDKKDCFVTYSNRYDLLKIFNNNNLVIEDFSIKEEIKQSLLKFDKEDLFFIEKNRVVSKKDNKFKLDLDGKTQQNQLIFDITQDSFVNLVTETRFSSLASNISEKSLKPMCVYRPFLMLSSYGTLDLLKKLGFQTFDKWWDESYDLEKNHVKRFEQVYSIANQILAYSISDLEKMLEEMRPILEHNKNNLQNITEKMFMLN
jgi:hypothetical protein